MRLRTFSDIVGHERDFFPERAYNPGKWDTDPIKYRNRQWAVTEYGLENIAGPYHYYIPCTDLHIRMGADGTWVNHMSAKNWVDIDAFNEAFQRALEIFGKASA